MATVLIIDDDDAVRDGLCETLTDQHHTVLTAASGRGGLTLLDEHKVDAVLLDLRMPGLDGIEVLRRIMALATPPPVAVLTAHATATNTIEAMRLGAFDHMAKPIGREELIKIVERMLSSRRRAEVTKDTLQSEELVGSSEAMHTVQKTIGLVADSTATVLITGETGSGKEVVARAIHRHGVRASKPFIALNCAAIPTELLESELFGHVKGAFTGALVDRKGAFREADGGTLFLDEIGDMDLRMQAKMLRASEERKVTPVGGREIAVDVRVIAATHRDLVARVQDGTFREDLLYRLNVVPLHLPALRERPADIVPLAEYFLRLTGKGAKRLSADAGAELLAHSWPGNVRELKNTMERVAVLARSDTIGATDLAFLNSEGETASARMDWLAGDLPTAVARVEIAMIERALAVSGGNRTAAARLLNIPRQQLYTKMKRYGMDVSDNPTSDVGDSDSG